MSVTVRHLNADSTFLLSFWPSSTSGAGQGRPFTILIDPWLSGSANIGPSWFVTSQHTIPASISSLSDIAAPDIVIVSQKQPDHCHEATLRQLRPEHDTWIVAEPGAAKTILGYKHFNPSRILKLRRYRAEDASSVLKFSVPVIHPSRGSTAEVSISFIPPQGISLTAVHNAIGITYSPPAMVPTLDISIPSADLDNSLSVHQHDRSSPHAEKYPQLISSPLSTDFPESTFSTSTVVSTPTSEVPSIFTATSPMPQSYTRLDTPESSDQRPVFHQSYGLHSGSTTITNHTRNLRPLSILYTPHGISLQTGLESYISTHLAPQSALPLTLLLHCFNRVDNPWILGGNIYAGAQGGTQIARAFQAQNWISAHDEQKNDRGLATLMLKFEKTPLQEIQELVSSASAAPVQTQTPAPSASLSSLSLKTVTALSSSKMKGKISFRRSSRALQPSNITTSTSTRSGGPDAAWKCAVRNLGPGEELFLTA
jgi:hypothetical protein